jgi:hypothetical protein
MGKPVNHIQRDACRCGPPPERCVPPEEVLTQFGWCDSKEVHCAVSWPGDNPIDGPQVPWPREVTALFDSCFNEETEARTNEP